MCPRLSLFAASVHYSSPFLNLPSTILFRRPMPRPIHFILYSLKSCSSVRSWKIGITALHFLFLGSLLLLEIVLNNVLCCSIHIFMRHHPTHILTSRGFFLQPPSIALIFFIHQQLRVLLLSLTWHLLLTSCRLRFLHQPLLSILPSTWTPADIPPP